jgi:hypothetical protein
MPTHDLVMMISQLALGAIAAFLAIVLWSSSRDAAWLFVILGVILYYGEAMFETFEFFGIVPADTYVIYGVSVVPVVLNALPLVCLILAFIIKLSKRD